MGKRYGKNAQPIAFDDMLAVGGVKYHLKCVVEHKGQPCDGGHYVAYKAVSPGVWYVCDDSVVPANFDWSIVKKAQAFMLFYERSDADWCMCYL